MVKDLLSYYGKRRSKLVLSFCHATLHKKMPRENDLFLNANDFKEVARVMDVTVGNYALEKFSRKPNCAT